MNMNLLQDFDSVYVENPEPTKMLIIEYSGSFDGDMVAKGVVVVKRNHIYLFRIELDPTNILFNYNGNFRIKRVWAYDSDKKRHGIVAKITSDDVGRITAEWNLCDSKYTDYSRSNKYKSYKQTILRKKV